MMENGWHGLSAEDSGRMAMTAALDTNAAIYLQKGMLDEALPVDVYSIFVITEMELLFPLT